MNLVKDKMHEKRLHEKVAGSDRIEIAHLTRTPPFAVGSFTGIINNVMRRMHAYKQVAISYWDGPPQDHPDVILTSWKQLSMRERMALRLPTRVRKYLFGGVGGRGCLAYVWQTQRILRALKPSLVVCYDEPWMGRLIRGSIDWPCRVIFSQHGLSYFLNTETAGQTYSLQSFDSVWTLTSSSYRFDRAHMPFYEPTVRVLPNPIDIESFSPVADRKAQRRAEWDLPQDRRIVLFLSVLRPKKGAHMLLQSWPEIMRRCPDAFLWIVGGGDAKYEKYVREMAQALGLNNSVKFQGRVKHDETPSCFQAADVYAFPTLFVEGMPLSLGEAMACGLPCVASEHTVAREAYSCEGLAFVDDPNLENAFVEPLVKILNDPALAARMGDAARQLLVARYSYDTVLPQVERAFSRELELVGAAPR